MVFKVKKKSEEKWLDNEIKRYKLAYVSYKNVQATAEKKPPTTWGHKIRW